MKPSQAQKDWANILRARIGGEAAVTMYGDEEQTTRIPIFTGKTGGGVIAATIGLMDVNQSGNPDFKVHSEVLIDSRRDSPAVPSILSTISFYVLKNEWKVAPGSIFEDIVSMYLPGTRLPHIYFTAPFQWKDLGKVELIDRIIYPLVAVPISSAEAALASTNKGNDLESLWERLGTDVLDWERESAL
jgi:hypothetical protein